MRLLLAVLLILTLIVLDLRYHRLETTRSVLDTLGAPVYWLADLLPRVRAWSETHIQSRTRALEENERLIRENLVLQGRSQQMAALQAENVRLRGLLNSTTMLRDDVLVAELIGVSPDPVRHQLVLNKGRNDGVFVTQPLIDADGLMGQIVEVSDTTSRALLITDATHSIPVQVNRNGVRAIAEGTGSLGALEVRHVSATTDIELGDLLVTSGLGGRFPRGYPVGKVVKVEFDPGSPFAHIVARPLAALDRIREVMLLENESGVSEPPTPAMAEQSASPRRP